METSINLYDEATRQFIVCNACRYCEGFCPVWPVMERRVVFKKSDIDFMANICHDCKACYYACPFIPPHEFNINIPHILSQVRLKTYKEYTHPRTAVGALSSNAKFVAVVILTSIALVAVAALAIGNPARLFSPQIGPNSFYAIFPYTAIVVAGVATGIFILAVFLYGVYHFFLDIGGNFHSSFWSASFRAALDALGHSGLKGGGDACYHDGSTHSNRFLVSHALILYGFISAGISTILAAIFQDGLASPPPYPILSAPVLFGIAGGILILTGAAIVLALHKKGDQTSVFKDMTKLDYGFLVTLVLVSASGLVTLALRGTSSLGIVFVIHLGLVLSLFVTAPYGKFVHFGYRYAALVVDKMEAKSDMVNHAE